MNFGTNNLNRVVIAEEAKLRADLEIQAGVSEQTLVVVCELVAKLT